MPTESLNNRQMANIRINNIFFHLSGTKKKEVFEVLKQGKNFKIERIISCGQSTPPGVWLKEKSDEWAVLLAGRAKLTFKGKRKPLNLKPGDYIYISANTSHRIDWTHPKQKTIWLAIHLFSYS